MKKVFIYFISLVLSFGSIAQSTLITPGDNQPNIIASGTNNGGITPPRMTSAQIAAIVAPVEGSIVYDTDINCLRLFDGISWKCQSENSDYVISGQNPYGIGNDEARDLAIFGEFVYVVGYFENSISFSTVPSTTLTTTNKSTYIAKYSKDGFCYWAKKIDGNAVPNSITTDENGNVYVGGSFLTAINFNPGFELGIGFRDLYIAKYTSSGSLLWGKTFGSTQADSLFDVAVDRLENLYVTGNFKSTIDFNGSQAGGNYSSQGGKDIFIARFNSATGAFISAKTTGLNCDESGTALFVDNSNNLYATGIAKDTVRFDNLAIGREVITLPGLGTQVVYLQGYVAKFNSNFDCIKLSKLSYPHGDKIKVRSANVFIGSANSNILAGPCHMFDVFHAGMTKLSEDFFGFNWVTDVYGAVEPLTVSSSKFKTMDFDVDKNGNIVLAVSREGGGSVDFGVQSYETFGYHPYYKSDAQIKLKGNDRDIIMAKYDSDFNLLEMEILKKSGDQNLWALKISENNEIFMVGSFTGSFPLTNYTLNNNGGTDSFLIKLEK